VAHFIQRVGFRYVTIIPSGDTLGHVKNYPFGKSFQPDVEVTLRMRDRLEKEIVIYYAGNEAEKKFCGRYNHWGSNGDFHSLVDLASYVAGGEEALEAYLKWLQLATRDMIARAENWLAVQKVAEALLEKKKLTSEEAKAIIRKAYEDHFGFRSFAPAEGIPQN
jgi:hypothetical protein